MNTTSVFSLFTDIIKPMDQVLNYLKQLNIEYKLHRHPAVFTVEEAQKYTIKTEGKDTKNLFLKESKNNKYYLLIIEGSKRANLKEVEKVIGSKKLSFASPEDLKRILDLTPGSVSPFGLINDKEKLVNLLIDKDLVNSELIGFHPNDNTATVELSTKDFMKYLDTLGYTPTTI